MNSTISIITVNYNSLSMTMALLRSLDQLKLDNLEIIVVDNASTLNPREQIKTYFPNVKVILSDENLGFAGGNNLGIKAATGDYLFFLNNDTVILEDIMTPMVELMSINHEIGVLCPVIKDYQSPHGIQYAGFSEINPLTGRNRVIQQAIDGNSPYSTAYPHGAAMMMRKSVINEAGLMPEEFFLYYEELDWGVKIRNAGYKILVDPRQTVYHKESASVGLQSPLKTFYTTRNRLLFMRRNVAGLALITFMAYYFLIAAPKAFIDLLINREWDHIRAFTSALWLIQLPSFNKPTETVPYTIPTAVLS